MPADPADISAGIRPARVEQWSDAAVKARYPSARDGLTQPAEGFFDTAANGATAIAARGAILGTERRRFTAEVDGLQWLDPSTGVPSVQLVDAEQAVDAPCLTVRIELDLDAERTRLELLG
jgi:hypothetical protein